LGIKEKSNLALLYARPEFAMEIPYGVEVRRRAQGHVDVIVAFFWRSTTLELRIGTMSQMIFPSGNLWIAWPKKTSGIVTDISDHAVRAIALPLGLVDNKVCAIDETWTALRMVWRRTLRSTTE
jgi:hypothetical protein